MNLSGIFLTIILPVLLGGLLVAPFHRFRGWWGWLSAGTVTGISLFAALSFIVALVQGKMTLWAVIVPLIILATAAYCVRRYFNSQPVEPYELPQADFSTWQKWFFRIAFLLLILLVFDIVSEIITINDRGYYIGFSNNYGDLCIHLHYMSSFIFGQNFPPENPNFTGTPLRYPFLIDFYSSVVWFASGNLEGSLEAPALVLGLALVVLLYQWTWHLTGSRAAGLLAPFLFFFNSNWGWVNWLRDVFAGKGFFPNAVYTKNGDLGLQWPNIIHALWVPQRSLQLAFPLLIFIFAVALDSAASRDKRRFFVLALLGGFLPFIHGHSIIVMGLMGLILIWRYPSRHWLYLLIPLGLLWLPQVLYLAKIIGPSVSESGGGFIKKDFFWESDDWKFLWFWLKNTGFFLPLLGAGLWFYRKNKPLWVLSLAALAPFVLGNLVTFAPWRWDNIKILIFSYIFAIPILAGLMVWGLSHKKIWLKFLAGIVVFLSLWSGTLDLYHALKKGGEDHHIYDGKQVKIAEWIRDNTPPQAVFLSFPTYNHALFLSGRKVIMGYPGHIWSHGYKDSDRWAHINRLRKGDDAFNEILDHYQATHAIYGPKEAQGEFDYKVLGKKMRLLHSAHRFIIFERK